MPVIMPVWTSSRAGCALKEFSVLFLIWCFLDNFRHNLGLFDWCGHSCGRRRLCGQEKMQQTKQESRIRINVAKKKRKNVRKNHNHHII
jgi:hypothetical protein